PGDAESRGLHWLTRIEMITDDEGRPSMHRRGSHLRVPIETMPLATRAVLEAAAMNDIWDGALPANAQLRVAVPEPRAEAAETATPGALRRAIGDNYAVIVDGKVRHGSRNLTERISVDGREFTYTVDAAGFWQMHREAPQALPQYVIDQVREALAGRAPRNGRNLVIWDLYSGSGLFTLPLPTLVDDHAKLVSIEGSKTAVANGRRNLKAAGVHTVQALCGDVLRTLEKDVDPQRAHPDVVVLDPPRAGAKAKVCAKIADSGAPVVVYIACDPASLARDTATLTRLGYALRSIAAFDIYPMTHHVETVAVFTR
ncbi:MAG: RsmD family RNA methyltransferase, partial [Bifidobacterium castoris]|nr:RsmD family RNA methyltransferase [Bifidobacterium castoris]